MPPAEAAGQLPPAVEPQEERELAQPLPPLDSVQVPAQVATDDNPDAKTQAVRYSVAVEGFGRTGLEPAFRESSALIDGGGKADTAAMVRSEAHTYEFQSLLRITYAVLC